MKGSLGGGFVMTFLNKVGLAGLVIAGVLTSAAASAQTVTEAFEFYSANNTQLASGSFSYDASFSGTLSFADLTSFSITGFGQTYNLSYVDSLNSPNDYVYFGFDTSTQEFVPAAIAGSQGPYSGILAATDLSSGFFFDPLVGSADPANTGADGLFSFYPQDYNVFAAGYVVPEPASLGALGVGLLAFGMIRRRRT